MTKKKTENKGHRVFISYANEKGDNTGSDRQIADMICSALESENIRCWIDHRDIMPGENWLNAILNAVEQSKLMVLVFSENANRSQWVQDEITYALDKKIRIIPFIVDNVTPKGALRLLKVRIQWIDAGQPPQQKDLKRLVDAVRTYLEKDKDNEEETAAPDVEIPVNNGVADFGDGIMMVYIPPGEFEMGSNEYDSEKPPHTVYLDGYRIGKYEVTVKQFGLFVKDTGYVTQAEKSGGAYTWIGEKWEQKEGIDWKNPGFKQDDNHPVVCVSWIDVLEYCKWLSGKKGVNFKLPTEANGKRQPGEQTAANIPGAAGNRMIPWQILMIKLVKRLWWVHIRQVLLPMVCWIWPGMSGNGAGIGMSPIIIKILPKRIQQARTAAPIAWCAAAVGATTPGACAAPIATATGPPIAAATLASASARTIKLFTFTLLPFAAPLPPFRILYL